MVSPAKHPNSVARKRDGENKSLMALEGGLKPLDKAPPSQVIEAGEKALVIWEREIIPLINRGILKETDYTSCTQYCILAAVPILQLKGPKLTYFARLKNDLGLTPKARLNLSSGNPSPSTPRLADLMKLNPE